MTHPSRKRTWFGKECAKLRIDANMTIQEMAKAMGVSTATVTSYEMGLTDPKPQYYEKLVDVFDLSNEKAVFLEHTLHMSKTQWRFDLSAQHQEASHFMLLLNKRLQNKPLSDAEWGTLIRSLSFDKTSGNQ